MKFQKLCVIGILLVSISNIVHAQQFAFQGTWIGEKSEWVDRSAYRIEISGNSWTQFYNNQINAAGTVRFSAGRAELLLADGRLARDLRLLAPGLIEQPISMYDGYYRFRQVSAASLQNLPSIRIKNSTGYTIYYVHISPVSSDTWGKDFLGDKILHDGDTLSFQLSQALIIENKYDIRLEDEDGDTYTKRNVIISSNMLIEFTMRDFDNNEL